MIRLGVGESLLPGNLKGLGQWLSNSGSLGALEGDLGRSVGVGVGVAGQDSFQALLQMDQYLLVFVLFLGASHQTSFGSSCRGAAETNPTRNHEVAGSIPGLAQWVKDPALP